VRFLLEANSAKLRRRWSDLHLLIVNSPHQREFTMARHRVSLEILNTRVRRPPVFYGQLEVLPDRRVRLCDKNVFTRFRFAAYRYRSVLELGFPEYGLYDSSNYMIGMYSEKEDLLMLAIRKGRLAEATLTPTADLRTMKRHVALIQEAGLGEWVKSGLVNTLRVQAYSPLGTPGRLRALKRYLDSL